MGVVVVGGGGGGGSGGGGNSKLAADDAGNVWDGAEVQATFADPADGIAYARMLNFERGLDAHFVPYAKGLNGSTVATDPRA